ncbi:MAG: AmmeMemoRadiSam system protein B [Ardenticatenales bacterium]|nr:AmmeMemoRadiSam system protein B [Ardenticatenales bacterium]
MSQTPTPLLKLRPVPIEVAQIQGRPALVFVDPARLAGRPVLLPFAFAPIVQLLDGTRDRAMLAADLAARDDGGWPDDVIDEVIGHLHRAFLLENEASLTALSLAVAAFRDLPARPPAHADAVYPAHAGRLADVLDGYLAAIGGHAVVRAGDDGPPDGPHADDIAWPFAFFSPHIDYARGGLVYAGVWHHARAAVEAADIAILIGTDHQGPAGTWSLTRQSYATPYGTLPTDTAAVDALAEAIGAERAFAGELRHREEHALELIAVWLHHMRGGRPIEVVPVLVGGFDHFEADPDEPERDATVRAAIERLRTTIRGRRALVIASGDLSHVGPAFGQLPMTDDDLVTLRSDDHALLERLCAGDRTGFFAPIQHSANRTNICGVAPFWLTMAVAEATGGTLIDYDQCPADDDDTSWVSIGGVVLHR